MNDGDDSHTAGMRFGLIVVAHVLVCAWSWRLRITRPPRPGRKPPAAAVIAQLLAQSGSSASKRVPLGQIARPRTQWCSGSTATKHCHRASADSAVRGWSLAQPDFVRPSGVMMVEVCAGFSVFRQRWRRRPRNLRFALSRAPSLRRGALPESAAYTLRPRVGIFLSGWFPQTRLINSVANAQTQPVPLPTGLRGVERIENADAYFKPGSLYVIMQSGRR